MPGLDGFVKYRDEGSGSLFMARIFTGLYDLLDSASLLVTPEEEKESVRDLFDERILPLTLGYVERAGSDFPMAEPTELALHFGTNNRGAIAKI